MNRLSIQEKNQLKNIFNADKLGNIDLEKFSRFSFSLSVFDHDLTREEFNNIYPLTYINTKIYRDNTLYLVNNLFINYNLIVYKYNRIMETGNFFRPSGLSELIRRVNKMTDDTSMFDICLPDLQIFIEGGYEFSHTVYGFSSSVDLSLFRKICRDANYYVYDRSR